MRLPYNNTKYVKKPLGDVTQWFGEWRQCYIDMGMKGHNGIDLARGVGEPHYAVEDATVVHVKDDPDGYGKHVRFLSKDGKRLWVFAHCSKIFVQQNQEIKEGDLVCLEGATGHVSGPHLHLGLRLTKLTKTGWSYEGSPIKFKILNYDNGYKGSIDPAPYLFNVNSKSYKIMKLASERQDKLLFKLSNLMRIMGK